MLPIIWWFGIIVCSLDTADTAKLIPVGFETNLIQEISQHIAFIYFPQNMGYYIEMKQMDCVGNPNYFANLYCRIIPPKNRTMEASVNIMQQLSVFSGSLRVSIPNAKKVITQIFDITFDVCKVLRERKRKILIDLLVNTLAKNSNAKAWRCPFPKVFNMFNRNSPLKTHLYRVNLSRETFRLPICRQC